MSKTTAQVGENGNPFPEEKEQKEHPSCCEVYTQEVTKFYQRLKELQEHIPARMDEVMQKLGTIEKQVSLQAGVIEDLSKGLANLTTPSQLKPIDDTNLGFPKIGKPETWQSATSKKTGETYYWTNDPVTVKAVQDMGVNAPQGYKIYDDRPDTAQYFPPRKRC